MPGLSMGRGPVMRWRGFMLRQAQHEAMVLEICTILILSLSKDELW
jgi:hypothetical protein